MAEPEKLVGDVVDRDQKKGAPIAVPVPDHKPPLAAKKHQIAPQDASTGDTMTGENNVETAVVRDSIGDILIKLGIKEKHVKAAVSRQQVTHEPLPVIARDMGLVSGEKIAEAIALHLGVEYFRPGRVETLDLVEMAELKELVRDFAGYVPVGHNRKGGVLVAIPSQEFENQARNAFADHSPMVCVASEMTIQRVYRLFFARTAEAFDALAIQIAKALAVRHGDDDSGGAVQRLLCNLLRHACYIGASDIYLWRTGRAGAIKIKVDGTGSIFRTLPLEVYGRLVNTLVLNSGKSDALRNEPQESKVDVPSESIKKEYDDVFGRYTFRMELVQDPVTGYVNAVIRLNDSQSSEADFSGLGFDRGTATILRRWSESPTGLVLVTGPTGSGKTTTLYSLMREIDPIDRAIFSIEKPVEYRHGSWIQHDLPRAVDEGSAARIMLKALLREAPDVILIGELRDDPELVKTALAAANTGHLVFASLHTNSAPRAVMRLTEIGAQREVLAAVLKGALAQRLVGLLCPNCKEPDTRPETMQELEMPHYLRGVEKTPFLAKGCEHCGFTGVRGRRMIYELMEGDRVRHLIEAGGHVSEIERVGIPPGQSLWASGLRLVAAGVASIDELIRRADRDVTNS